MSNASQNQKPVCEPASSMDEMKKSFGEMGLLDKDEDPEKVICFGKKALDMLLSNERDYVSSPLAHERSLTVGCVLNMLGFACLDLKSYYESLKYFNWSNRKLSELLEDGNSSSPVLDCLLDTHVRLFKLKNATGRRDDAPRHIKKVMEIKEKIMEEDYVISNGAEKLEFGSKVTAFVLMARTLCVQGEFEESRKYMETACGMFENEVMDPLLVAAGFCDLSLLYDTVKDFKTAVLLLRRVLKMPELSKKLLLVNYKRFFALISKRGTEEEGFPYLEEGFPDLEDAVQRLKGSFGPKHSEEGYGYCNLAVACMNLRKRHEAVKYFKIAKEIMDASLGPRHTDSLKTSQTLSMGYAITGRRDLAIPCQEKVVEGMKAAGASEEGHLVEAVALLRALQSGSRIFFRGEF